MLIRRAELLGRGAADVRIKGGRVQALAPSLSPDRGESVLDAGGGTLLPGLHDHHLHLFALAAARSSVRCGPPEVRDEGALARALRDGARIVRAPAWLRGTGYHESVAGELDRDALDRWLPDTPARIQHRSGALWLLNSRAIDVLDLDRGVDAPGVDRDPAGRATGRLFRLDGWLRERTATGPWPDLAPIADALARFGVTGVTDATASNGAAELGALTAAQREGQLTQRLLVMGTHALPLPEAAAAITRGPVKLVLAESELPSLASLAEEIARAHAAGRSAAVHCVTRAELLLALAAFETAGPAPGDRVEHASVAPPEALATLATLGLTVVTQPNFVCERGDAYLHDVSARDRPDLYRCRSVEAARIPLGGGTDAPFGDPDPWRAMRAAVDRRTEAGQLLGPGEALDPERALALFTSAAAAPGGPPREIDVGAPADLCLLDRPWDRAREHLSSEHVVATWIAGHCRHGHEHGSRPK